MGIQRGDITPGSEGYPHIRGVGGEAASGTCALIDGRRIPSSEVTNENQEKKMLGFFFVCRSSTDPLFEPHVIVLFLLCGKV